jgi:putative addiction module component (TIGR02574 family)
MLSQRDEILQQILALPPEDRAFVVAAIEQSLGPSPPDAVRGDSSDALAGADLLSELQRRSSAYREGRTTARSADEVLTDLRRRQADESRA